MKFAVDKCPTEEGTFTNLIYVSLDVAKEIDPNYDPSGCKKSYITIRTSKGFAFAISHSDAMKGRDLGFNGIQRKWLGLGLRSEVDVNQIQIKERFLASLTLEVDFLQKNRTSNAKYDTDLMAEEVRSSFLMTPFSLDQNFVFRYQNKQPYLLLRVKEMTLINTAAISGQNKKPINVDMGVITANTIITFDRKEESVISLTGKAVGKSGMPNIINPDWDFSKMGIGGLDDEFSAIFRRAFASRVFPPELIEQLNMTHVKGILLFGPPGTGKTLMARQVGKMLNTREPKIVNGPEILNKYVGESEKNIRELFKEAEEDQKKFKINSPLHMIIFDEIDAICKQRGTVTGSTGVADTVVNQLLSKIDGVEQLNNILIIGMTNRKDLIDEALLRPGRLEVQMEIGLPDEKGRVQILGIHTAKLKESNKLGDDVSLEVLASMTKNFSGAELEGVVRAANTTAMNRLIKVDGKVNIDRDAVENLRVTQSDFLHAVTHDIRPKFGAGSDDADHFIANGIIHYGDPINDILSTATLLINQAKNGKMISPVTVLLQGVQGSGKTALAAHIAYKMSGFPCVKVVSPEKMIGFSEGSKCQTIKNIFDDAGKSELSCIIVDDIERLLDYVPIGPRFSNVVLQSLIVLLKKNLKRGKRLLIIGTSSLNRNVLGMANLQLLPCFNNVIDVPTIHDIDSMVTILRETGHLTENQILEIQQEIARRTTELDISVKRLTSLVEMASEADEDSVVLEFVTLMRDYFAK